MAARIVELFNAAIGLDGTDRATLAGLLLESLGPAQRAATNVASGRAVEPPSEPTRVELVGWEEFWRSCSGA